LNDFLSLSLSLSLFLSLTLIPDPAAIAPTPASPCAACARPPKSSSHPPPLQSPRLKQGGPSGSPHAGTSASRPSKRRQRRQTSKYIRLQNYRLARIYVSTEGVPFFFLHKNHAWLADFVDGTCGSRKVGIAYRCFPPLEMEMVFSETLLMKPGSGGAKPMMRATTARQLVA